MKLVKIHLALSVPKQNILNRAEQGHPRVLGLVFNLVYTGLTSSVLRDFIKLVILHCSGLQHWWVHLIPYSLELTIN